jgi:CheY-like chemotaxis protein
MARILVVDDDPDFVEIIRLVLTAHGYEVETASNGEMALRYARQNPPDLVLLDVMMSSVLDGVHVAHVLSQDAALGHPPIIMISSIADSPMSAHFPTNEYLPIDAWLSKPVAPEELLKRVALFVGKPDAAAEASVHAPNV